VRFVFSFFFNNDQLGTLGMNMYKKAELQQVAFDLRTKWILSAKEGFCMFYLDIKKEINCNVH